MDIYVTTEKMLGREPLTSLLQSQTKKERLLYIFHSSDSQISFQDAGILLSAAKRMQIQFMETKDCGDFAFSLGYLAGTLKTKCPIYTILQPDCEISDSVREMFHLEEYRPTASVSLKKVRSTRRVKETAVSELVTAKQKLDIKESDLATGETGTVPPVQPKEPKPAKEGTAGNLSPTESNNDPLFFSSDSEVFFCKQLGSEEHYKVVAECMKNSGNDKTKAEHLVRDKVSLSGVDMEKLLCNMRQKWDILLGCLFIRRK